MGEAGRGQFSRSSSDHRVGGEEYGKRMNCPHCSAPIPDAVVVKAAASINARKNRDKGSRPCAMGLVRNPAGRPKRKPEGEGK
jgi:hypothetical protein